MSTFDKEFTKYLSESCDESGCSDAATHNQPGRGKFCNQHTDWGQPAFARDD